MKACVHIWMSIRSRQTRLSVLLNSESAACVPGSSTLKFMQYNQYSCTSNERLCHLGVTFPQWCGICMSEELRMFDFLYNFRWSSVCMRSGFRCMYTVWAVQASGLRIATRD
eukprot:gb/GECG01011349.1/.p1 GENE.gb/GECG01011349.1/~~gb/GECG01011349.1/.p1  ORF type:complete len:112 (+),score=3.16 gb/GECG01011349.1/:1-336(+)